MMFVGLSIVSARVCVCMTVFLCVCNSFVGKIFFVQQTNWKFHFFCLLECHFNRWAIVGDSESWQTSSLTTITGQYPAFG